LSHFGPIASQPDKHGLNCLAANVGTTPVTLNIELHGHGTVVAQALNCVLAPGAITGGVGPCPGVGAVPNNNFGYCTFTVTSGSKNKIRASINKRSGEGLADFVTSLPAN